jgi:hypothetical protein
MRLVVLVTCALLARQAEKPPVGFIERMTGAPGDFALELPGGQRETLSADRPLRAGDRIVVLKDTSHVLLALEDGSMVRVCHPQSRVELCDPGSRAAFPIRRSPYQLVEPPEASGMARALFDWMLGYLAQWKPAEREVTIVDAALPRGDDLMLPLMPADMVVYRVTVRPSLEIAWYGGEAPFTVSVFRDADRAKVAERSGVSERFAAVEPAPAVGAYALLIADSTGRALVQRRFEVVSRARAPVTPQDLVRHAQTEQLQDLTRAAWLAGLDNGEWRWEAYQLVSHLPVDYAPAQVMKYLLERGVAPRLP